MSEQRDRASRLARRYWRRQFGSDAVLELVIDLMCGFADFERQRQFDEEHGIGEFTHE